MLNFLDFIFGPVVPRRGRGFPRVGSAVCLGQSREVDASQAAIWMNFPQTEPNKQPFGADWALRSFSACLILPWLILPAFVILVNCVFGDPFSFDIPTEISTGEAARAELDDILSTRGWSGQPPFVMPASAKDFYCFSCCGWDGVCYFWSFECETIEECWAVMESQCAEGAASFKPWSPSEYAVVMLGPGYCNRSRAAPKWDVRSIAEGVCFERAEDDSGRIEYYAIDFARRRVYGHRATGGFSRAKYRGPVPRVAHGG